MQKSKAAAASTQPDGVRVIKKYPNRRLYDTDTSSYITLTEVKTLVMDNEPFVVRDAGGCVVGSTRFYDIDRSVPRVKLGYTWYAPRVQRSGVNTEVKRMLLQYAFETLQCLSVGFETSWFNHRSRAAIARLGAKQDGVLRNHKRHSDGSPRDTVVFSIIDGEWPAVKRNLLAKLARHEQDSP
mgnify:CR=1 FL=1